MTQSGRAIDTIESEVWIDAPPETVFTYFTDPEKHQQWLAPAITLEPWPNGIYRVHSDTGRIMLGEFVEVVPPERLVFTWGWVGGEMPPSSTRVEVTLAAENGGTRLRVRHTGFVSEDSRERHETGWRDGLKALKTCVSTTVSA